VHVEELLDSLDPGLDSLFRALLESALVNTEHVGQEKIEEQVESHHQICNEVETAPKVLIVRWQHYVWEIGCCQ
jgi:hypothetical protein